MYLSEINTPSGFYLYDKLDAQIGISTKPVGACIMTKILYLVATT